MSTPNCTAIIVASGTGSRLGMDKLLWSLAGKPVLWHAIHAFVLAKRVSSIVVVCPFVRWEQLPPFHADKPIVRVDGGIERQDSVACGLAALPDDSAYVAVHDGARPLVSPDDIDDCIAAAIRDGGAVLSHPAVDTMKRADANGFCCGSVPREQVWCMETPQTFRTDWLRQSFAAVEKDRLAVTDEVSAAEHAGFPVRLVPSTHPNPKITFHSDLGLAAALADIGPVGRTKSCHG